MSTFTPARNPMGQNLGVTDVLLQRPDAPSIDVVATFKNAFEMVKTYPAETVGGMVAVIMITMIINFVLAFATGIVMGIVVAIVGDAGSGITTAVTVLQVIVQLFTTVISAVLMGGYNIMWLRMIRGNTVSFQNMMDVRPFVIAIGTTTILTNLAIGFSALVFILPGVFMVIPMVVEVSAGIALILQIVMFLMSLVLLVVPTVVALGLCMTQIVVVD